MQFSDILGQENIKNHLQQSANNGRIPHAQLFVGNEGSGTLPTAIAYAQYLLCLNSENEDSCNIKCDKLSHPDMHFAFPVTSNDKVKKHPVSNLFLSEWRQFISEQPYGNLFNWLQTIGVENKQGIISKNESYEILKKLNLKTFEAEYKVMIIWQPERMNQSCSNKLLKMLEEPPPKTLFLLVSVFPALVIPTLLSRVQVIRIPGIEDTYLMEALTEKLNLPDLEISNAVRIASGNYIKALAFINSSEERNHNFELFTKWMRLCYKKDVPGILEWVDEASALGREKKKVFLNYALALIRENFLWNQLPDHKDQIIKLPENESIFTKNFSPFINEQNINQISELINKAIFDIEANAYPKTVFLDSSIQVMGLLGK